MPPPPKLADSPVGFEHCLCCDPAEGHDDAGVGGLNLSYKEWSALQAFFDLRLPAIGRTAFDHVGDVGLVWLESHGLNHALQELTRGADKGAPLEVLLLSGGLADEDHIGLGVSPSKNELCPFCMQITALAFPEDSLDVLESRRA